MVVIVIGDSSGFDRLGTSGGEVEAIECPFGIVEDQRFAVRCPVGRLDGIGYLINRFAMAGGHIEDLEVAAEGHLGRFDWIRLLMGW